MCLQFCPWTKINQTNLRKSSEFCFCLSPVSWHIHKYASVTCDKFLLEVSLTNCYGAVALLLFTVGTWTDESLFAPDKAGAVSHAERPWGHLSTKHRLSSSSQTHNWKACYRLCSETQKLTVASTFSGFVKHEGKWPDCWHSCSWRTLHPSCITRAQITHVTLSHNIFCASPNMYDYRCVY